MNSNRRLRESKAGFRAVLRRLRALARPPVTITEPPPEITFDRDRTVPMRDGTTLRVNVFRPPEEGTFPVLMCAHPYGKDALPTPGHPLFTYRIMYQTEPITHSAWTGWEGPDPAFWVPRGYVVVNADLRGFGTSDGVGNLLTQAEGRDYYDLIEWAAREPWSNGRVGLNGVSYLAISQWRAASLRPPSLAAICPWEGFTDLYEDFAQPGGIREDGFFRLWSGALHKRCPVIDLRKEQLRRANRDEWWQSLVPDLASIDVPALVCASFSDHNLHTGGSFRGFAQIASGQKWLYTHRAPKWATYYSPDALATQVAFFDHFLNGADNGFASKTPVRVEVRDTREHVHRIIETTTWPPAEVVPLTLYLRGDGTLATSRDALSHEATFELRRGRLTYTWEAPDDLELIGPMTLRLTLDVDGTGDPSLFVGVRKFANQNEVPFEGSYGFPRDMVTNGWRRVAYRNTGSEHRASPWDVPVSFDEPHLLDPRKPVSIEISLPPSATLFRRGEILRLDIQGRWFRSFNPFLGQFPARYKRSLGGTCRLHVGGDNASALIVPHYAPAPA